MRSVTQACGAVAAAVFLALLPARAAATVAGLTAAGAPTAGDSFSPQLGLPATHVVAFGSSQGEAAGEVWAYGELGSTPTFVDGREYSDQYALLERTDAMQDWHVVPLPDGPDGEPLATSGEHNGPAAYGALAGEATEAGGVVLLSGHSIVARNPEEAPILVSQPEQASSGSDEHGLALGESLLPQSASGESTVPYAAIEEQEEDGHRVTGVLIAPYHDGGKQSATGQPEVEPGVLHYDGHEWMREPIVAEGGELEHFGPLAISCSGTSNDTQASSPGNCWLLASYTSHGEELLALFRRMRSGGAADWDWRLQPVHDWIGDAVPPSGVSSVSPAPLAQGAQMLTATSAGVWVDFQARAEGSAKTTDVSELVLRPSRGSEEAQVAGTWCYPTGAICKDSLGATLPSSYRSFAWPGTSGEPRARVITGLPEGALLELSDGSFSYTPGAGGESGNGGAALYRPSPQQPIEGWIASGQSTSNIGRDSEGQSKAIAITTHPEADQLQEEAVPFRQPLLAVTQAPGTTVGDPTAEALAVGVNGEIGRYVPGVGWEPEALYVNSSEGKKAATPTLRGVAWPEPHRAYAVGDNGNMWMWMKETGYWVPDPARPFNFIGNLTAIAFDPGDSQLGYAVGKEGVLLKYGKSWAQISTQEKDQLEQELKVEEWRLNFTAVAFAGHEALATYRVVTDENGSNVEAGGMLVNEGAGWHVDSSMAALLASFPRVRDTVLSKVAGLPEGGAVAAGPDFVMEREAIGSPWHLSQAALPEEQNVSALAAYREPGGPVRAVVSIELDWRLNPANIAQGGLEESPFGVDVPAPAGASQPPPFIEQDPLPNSGYVLEETAYGWNDLEHEAFPVQTKQSDMPIRPEPVFALLVEPSGRRGLAVGGQTYDSAGYGPELEAETAGAMRFPAAAEQHQIEVPLAAPTGEASFAVGGKSECSGACYDLANEEIGPEVWFTHALQTAGRTVGVRAFMYIGSWTAGAGIGGTAEVEAFKRELGRFKQLLDVEGAPAAYVAAGKELAPSVLGSKAAEPFNEMIRPREAVPGPSGTTAYAVKTEGAGGSVWVISLDYIGGTLGPEQELWLESRLALAKAQEEPAVVMGYDPLDFELNQVGTSEAEASDAEAVSRILVEGGASAYLFEYPGVNVKTQVAYDGKHIEAFGTGTLGGAESAIGQTEPLYSSGYLVVSVDTAKRNAGTNVAPVTAQVVPNAGRLSLNATGGSLLQRSKVALFEGLARRPAAGMVVGGSNQHEGPLIYPHSYDPIPAVCQGPNCRFEIPLEYKFRSSKPDVGNFVEHETTQSGALEVALGANHKPIPDEHSGLFCAYNEGTTVVSIEAGGLSYSLPVTVQGGSSEYPCGTVPLEHPPARYETSLTPFPLVNPTPSGAAPVNPQIQSIVPPPPPKPVHHPGHQAPRVAQMPAVPAALIGVPPPPLATAPATPQPTPPSGTAQVPAQSPVSQTVGATEREEEVEGAYQHVHNMAAYQREEPMPTWPIALIVIAAAAAAGLRPRRDRDGPVYAWARGWRKDL